MKSQIIEIKDIKPAPYNPRKKLKPGDSEWEALNDSIEKFDLAVPLIINKTTGFLVSGHQRLEVLKARGTKKAEVVFVEITPEKEKSLNIALNKISGDWDEEKLKDLLQEFDIEDISITGFSQEELDKMFDLATESVDDFNDEKQEEKISEVLDKEIDFTVFLSFPTKEAAEQWLKSQGVTDATYENFARNITIKMEGTDYGKRS